MCPISVHNNVCAPGNSECIVFYSVRLLWAEYGDTLLHAHNTSTLHNTVHDLIIATHLSLLSFYQSLHMNCLKMQDVMPVVFDMLDSSRDVFVLAFMNKSVQSFVTREVVVRTAVFNDGMPRNIIANVMESVDNESIFLPSPLRLLRLINSKQCECLDECWSYNVVTKKAAALSRTCKRPFGLSICKECVKGLSVSLPYNHFATAGTPSNRVCHDWRVLQRPFVDRNGQRHGAIIDAKQLAQIKNTFRGIEEQKEALDQLLEAVDDDVSDEVEVERESMIEAYEDAEERVGAFLRSKREIANDKRKVTSRNGRGRREKILKELETLLEDYQHKNLALLCSRDEDWGTVNFKLQPAHHTLFSLFSASSSATKKKIKAAADSLREVFDMLHPKNLLTDNFLSFLSESSDPFERALYQRFLSTGLTPEKLLSTGTGRWNPTYFARDDKFLEILNMSPGVENVDFATAFASVVVPTVEDLDNTDLENLAKSVWVYEATLKRFNYSFSSEKFHETNTTARLRFQRVKENLQIYLRKPEIEAFIQDETPPENEQDQDQIVTRRRAVMSIYIDRDAQLELYYHRYGRLLSRHQGYFRNPSRMPRELNVSMY